MPLVNVQRRTDGYTIDNGINLRHKYALVYDGQHENCSTTQACTGAAPRIMIRRTHRLQSLALALTFCLNRGYHHRLSCALLVFRRVLPQVLLSMFLVLSFSLLRLVLVLELYLSCWREGSGARAFIRSLGKHLLLLQE